MGVLLLSGGLAGGAGAGGAAPDMNMLLPLLLGGSMNDSKDLLLLMMLGGMGGMGGAAGGAAGMEAMTRSPWSSSSACSLKVLPLPVSSVNKNLGSKNKYPRPSSGTV